MVSKEFLDSDRVNFLVWRYLLEGNYRETAAKFQKEWRVQKPHRDFPFARHVKSHALVSVINRGLVYYALERDHARGLLPEDAPAAVTEALQMGIFGPLNAHQPGHLEEADEDAEGEEDIDQMSRKRAPQSSSPTELLANKRPRLSNGLENGLDIGLKNGLENELENGLVNGIDATAAATTTAATTTTTTTANTNNTNTTTTVETPMDIDSQADNHAYPSPYDGGEQAPEPIARTDGPEQGTQVDKVEELSAVTTFFRLNEDDHAQAQGSETSPSSPASANLENAPILLHCEWNPKDPSFLAAAGTDALARVWTVSRVTPTDPGRDHVPAHAFSLLGPNISRDTTVTALSWTPDGSSIAIATDSKNKAVVSIWSADGTHLQDFEISEPPIVKLSWNPCNTALLAISPDKGGALITVYYAHSRNWVFHFLPGHDIAATPLDAVWTCETEFLLSGGDLLLSLQCTDSAITVLRKFETKEDDSFTQVLFDPTSNLAATSSDRGTLHLWDDAGQRRSISAHQGAITAMQWQPLHDNQPIPDDERLIATGGDDCAILIWNARAPENKPKCFLTMDSPIVRLAFTPDGAFIAGATATQVLIWKVGNHAMPRASWSRPPHPGWLSPKTSSESDEEDEHCLCWDASGQKLAYGSNSRLAVIRFNR